MAVRIDKAFFTAFDQASPVCHGLPAASYTCREFFEFEANQLFAASWSFVGFAHQLGPKWGRETTDCGGQAGISGTQ
ncbi:MAG: hypothetical protein Ct9H300mP14_04340 [Gammaproteobacteria bacterium]|nr:MAG: hypothetical protein Ct9H300mP14_04340 [Gammaproteobacteria bacterium]